MATDGEALEAGPPASEAQPPPPVIGLVERPQHARRRRRRRRLHWSAVVVLVGLVAAAGLVARQRLSAPLAQPVIATGRVEGSVVPGTVAAAPWPPAGQAAVSVPALGYLRQSGPEAPVPIASLAKMATAVVVLRDHPVPLGSGGATITVTADEANQFGVDLDNDETNIPLQAGEQLTELQLLEALLDESANDAAYTLAMWDAGSLDAFTSKMNALSVSVGATRTHYTDVSGFDPGSVSTAADMLRVAAVGMAIPTFASVAGMQTVTLPLAGTVHNIVHAIGSDGVVGVKSGYTSQSAGCMVLAGYRTMDGRSVLVLASALGQSEPEPGSTPSATAPGAGATATATPYSPLEAQYPLLYTEPVVDRLLDTTESAVVPVHVAEPGRTVVMASVERDGTRLEEPADATRGAWLLAMPGQRVTTTTVADGSGSAHAARTAATARFVVGTETADVPVRLAHRLPDPSWWWKLVHN